MRRSTADGLGAAAASEAEEPALFENPTDLLCPITLQLFKVDIWSTCRLWQQLRAEAAILNFLTGSL